MAEVFEIAISIQNENELYNSFDDSKMTISSDVIDYIFEKYQNRGLLEKLVIHIISDEPVDKDNLTKAFQNYLDTQRLQLTKQKRRNMVKQLWMFGIGVVFIGFGIYATDKLPTLIGEIISTVGAFSMWEAASIWIVENPGNSLKKHWIDILEKTEIVCEVRKNTSSS